MKYRDRLHSVSEQLDSIWERFAIFRADSDEAACPAFSIIVTKFWKITLMGAPEIIEFLSLPQFYWHHKNILNIFTLFFVIQSIFTVLET